MGLLDPFPHPRVGRPVRHRLRLPLRLVRGIPPTVLSRRRDQEAQRGEQLGFAEVIETQAERIAGIIRERLLSLRRRLRELPGFGWTVRS
jgi:hypothetical protein